MVVLNFRSVEIATSFVKTLPANRQRGNILLNEIKTAMQLAPQVYIQSLYDNGQITDERRRAMLSELAQ